MSGADPRRPVRIMALTDVGIFVAGSNPDSDFSLTLFLLEPALEPGKAKGGILRALPVPWLDSRLRRFCWRSKRSRECSLERFPEGSLEWFPLRLWLGGERCMSSGELPSKEVDQADALRTPPLCIGLNEPLLCMAGLPIMV